MYSVLLVDDERPALNYLRAIFQKYLPDFEVRGLMDSADDARRAMEESPVDLLVTDISMPGQNGIALAKWTRENRPQTHIVIVSGYAEFEYARGAIQTGADDYLLKPVGILRMREIICTIQQKLDAEYAAQREQALQQLIANGQADTQRLRQLFGDEKYRFAIVRHGNLGATRTAKLRSAVLRPLACRGWTALYGRDEQETLLLQSSAARTGSFKDNLTALLDAAECAHGYTAIYEIKDCALEELPGFLKRALPMLNHAIVIGCTQCLAITTPLHDASNVAISPAFKKRLASFVESGNTKLLKELFISLASEWEQNAIPQLQAEDLCHQLITHSVDLAPNLKKRREQIMLGVKELYNSAVSYDDLLSKLYTLLFEETFARDRSTSAEELCEYTLTYIRDNYAHPLNIQSICNAIGISQTYLSRLLRKYADTTFNTYLTQCRMEAAKEMLRKHPDILLHDVATCVGYDDQSYFSKIFRNETGMTPKQYASRFAGDADDPSASP